MPKFYGRMIGVIRQYIWVIDQPFSINMAGFWSFFACLRTKTESSSINSQKKERGQYPAILNEQESQAGKIAPILPALVANHRVGYLFSSPLIELAT